MDSHWMPPGCSRHVPTGQTLERLHPSAGVALDKLKEVAGEREVLASLIRLLPHDPPRIYVGGWMYGWNGTSLKN